MFDVAIPLVVEFVLSAFFQLHTIDVKNVFHVFFIIFTKNAFLTFFIFGTFFYFLEEKFLILLNPLKSY